MKNENAVASETRTNRDLRKTNYRSKTYTQKNINKRHSSLFSLSRHYINNRIHQSNHERSSVESRNKTKLHLNATNTVFYTVRNFLSRHRDTSHTTCIYSARRSTLGTNSTLFVRDKLFETAILIPTLINRYNIMMLKYKLSA